MKCTEASIGIFGLSMSCVMQSISISHLCETAR